MVNPPGLTNHVAVVQVDHDVTARAQPERAAGVHRRHHHRPAVSRRPAGPLVRQAGGVRLATGPGDRARPRSEAGDPAPSPCAHPAPAAYWCGSTSPTTAPTTRRCTIGLAVESAVVHAGHPWIEQIDEPWGSPFSPTAAEHGDRGRPPADRAAGGPLGNRRAGAGTRSTTVGTIGGPPDLLQASATVPAGATRGARLRIRASPPAAGTDDGGERAAHGAVRRLPDHGRRRRGGAGRLHRRCGTPACAALFTPGNDEFSGMPAGAAHRQRRAPHAVLVGGDGRALVPPRQPGQRARAAPTTR